jgi:hypothetical protein
LSPTPWKGNAIPVNRVFLRSAATAQNAAANHAALPQHFAAVIRVDLLD